MFKEGDIVRITNEYHIKQLRGLIGQVMGYDNELKAYIVRMIEPSVFGKPTMNVEVECLEPSKTTVIYGVIMIKEYGFKSLSYERIHDSAVFTYQYNALDVHGNEWTYKTDGSLYPVGAIVYHEPYDLQPKQD